MNQERAPHFGGVDGSALLRHHVAILVKSTAPTFDEEREKQGRRKQRPFVSIAAEQ
jgi:hypothetical protein